MWVCYLKRCLKISKRKSQLKAYLITAFAAAALAGCQTYPYQFEESGYYQAGHCRADGMCVLPSPIAGRFPKGPPDLRPLCTEKLLARHADCHW